MIDLSACMLHNVLQRIVGALVKRRSMYPNDLNKRMFSDIFQVGQWDSNKMAT